MEERGLKLDEDGFNQLLKEQKARSKANIKDKDAAWEGNVVEGIDKLTTEFTGYCEYETASEVIALIGNNALISSANAGDDVLLVLAQTPFYAESGGQVADTGVITTDNGTFRVTGVRKINGRIVHEGVLESGVIEVGDKAMAVIDGERRTAIRRNHTSVHLLQAALRQVLGTHVHQAGSLVDEHKLRFDFTHFSAVSAEELEKVEKIVNEKILEGIPVVTVETDLETAKNDGAMALFGEKYGNVVRECRVGDFSVELCGGTHIDNTAKIGLFKITSESSVASGVRRIEAVTGWGVLDLLNHYKSDLQSVAAVLKVANLAEVPTKVAAVNADLKERDRKIDELNREIADLKSGDLLKNAEEFGGIAFVSHDFTDVSVDSLRSMSDRLKDKMSNIVLILTTVNADKSNVLVVCGSEAVKKGVHAGKIVKQIAELTGGKGGGRPDSAMAGIGDRQKLTEAVEAARKALKEILQ